MDPRELSMIEKYADCLQVGTRNMHNFSLLKEVGRSRLPVVLKRGFSATIYDLIMSAEYILNEGNSNVVLCERGIRTFETAARYTLDLSAVPILKSKTHLPRANASRAPRFTFAQKVDRLLRRRWKMNRRRRKNAQTRLQLWKNLA